ncbi:CAP-Gly domain-containing linker protein 1 [Ceratocystis lukuohia]|uniref:CAP-Gly domain-containing linker protein 1 n=1 Tax=Ceratocystis lukuohia TaxID=2019550 RepID=A0ABR4MPJ4_9PEZI
MARWSKFNDTHNTSGARDGSRNYDNGSSGGYSASHPHEDDHTSMRGQDTNRHHGKRRDSMEISHRRSSYDPSERRDTRPSKRSEFHQKEPRRDLVRVPSRSPSPREAKRPRVGSSIRNIASNNRGSDSPTQRDAYVDGSRKSLSRQSSIVSPSIDLLEPPTHSQGPKSSSLEQQEQQQPGDLEASALENPTKCSPASSIPSSPRNGDKRPYISTNAVRTGPTVQGIKSNSHTNSKIASSASGPTSAHQSNNQPLKKSLDSPKSPMARPKNIAKSSTSTDPTRLSFVQSPIERRASDAFDPKIMGSQPAKSLCEDFQPASGKEPESNDKKTTFPSIISETRHSWNALIEPFVNLIHSHISRDQLQRQVEKTTQTLEKHISRYPEVRAQADLPRHRISVLQKQLSDAEANIQSCGSALEDVFPLFQQLCHEYMPSTTSPFAPSPLSAPNPSLALLEEKFERKFQDQKTVLDRQESLLRSYEEREREHQNQTKKLEERIIRMEESRQSVPTPSENLKSSMNVSRQIQDAIKAERSNTSSIVGQIEAKNRKLMDASYEGLQKNVSRQYVTQHSFQSKMSKLEMALKKVETDIRSVEATNYKRENIFSGSIDEASLRQLQDDTRMCQKLVSSYQTVSDENTAAVTKELQEVQLKLTHCLSNMTQLESVNNELKLDQKFTIDSLASLESKASDASSMATKAHTQLDATKESIMKEVENIQNTLAGSLENCETRLTEIQEKQRILSESVAKTTERLSEVYEKQSIDSAQLPMSPANLKGDIDASLDRKTLKSVMKKMKNLEETQSFVVNSWGSQLDDLRGEIPTIIEDKLSEHKAAVQRDICDSISRMSKSGGAENDGNASDKKQTLNRTAASGDSKTVSQSESQVGKTNDAGSYGANPTAAAVGPVPNVDMSKIEFVLESLTETQAKMTTFESNLQGLIHAFETIQAQYQNLRASDIYESIVEHLELWHPSSTRTMLDDLRSRIDETNNKLQEVLAMDQGSLRAVVNGVASKKRHLDGSAVVMGGIPQ